MLGIGLAAALVPTAIYALPGLLVNPERVGFAFGFITMFSNLGTIVGPAAVGALIDRAATWPLVWGVLAGIAVRHRGLDRGAGQNVDGTISGFRWRSS